MAAADPTSNAPARNTAGRGAATPAPVVELIGISRSYSAVQALDGVDFRLHAGEVCSLIGENGAGKSTLMKILAGSESPEAGEIRFDGKPISALTPQRAHDLGVAMVFQEPDLIADLTVRENVVLGQEPRGRFHRYDRKSAHARTVAALAAVGARIDPSTLVSDLNPATRQLVQIAKGIAANARILILDEPGAVLNDHELKHLFELMRKLVGEGRSIVHISHRLQEVTQVADRVTVLRDGQFVSDRLIAESSQDLMINEMVGRDVESLYARADSEPGQVILKVENLSVDGRVRNVSFELRQGEILGLAGLAGAGRSSALKAIAGVIRASRGRVEIHGKNVARASAAKRVREGFAIVPEDRRHVGLLRGRTILDNMVVRLFPNSALGVLRWPLLRRRAEGTARSVGVKAPSLDTVVDSLSGGNQQKVVVGRWLAASGIKVLLLDEPTAGVDIGAKAELHGLMAELAAQGVGVIIASSDLPEILNVADRILVFADGEVTGELAGKEADQEAIMRLAMKEKGASDV